VTPQHPVDRDLESVPRAGEAHRAQPAPQHAEAAVGGELAGDGLRIRAEIQQA